jgi:hypothetical protein
VPGRPDRHARPRPQDHRSDRGGLHFVERGDQFLDQRSTEDISLRLVVQRDNAGVAFHLLEYQ